MLTMTKVYAIRMMNQAIVRRKCLKIEVFNVQKGQEIQVNRLTVKSVFFKITFGGHKSFLSGH